MKFGSFSSKIFIRKLLLGHLSHYFLMINRQIADDYNLKNWSRGIRWLQVIMMSDLSTEEEKNCHQVWRRVDFRSSREFSGSYSRRDQHHMDLSSKR
jgi:hypothetical protein